MTSVPIWAKRGDKVLPSLSLLFAGLAVLCFAAYPMYVIRPFREQTSAALERALWVLQHNKPLILIAAFVAWFILKAAASGVGDWAGNRPARRSL